MRLWCVLLCVMFALPARAEMASDDYQTEAGSLSPEEREAARQRLAERIAAERARAEDAAQKAQAEAEARAAARAARPLGEKLVEARCLTCHDRPQIDAAEFGPLGWNITVLRMQWLNGAELKSGDRRVIVSHLAAASQGRAVLEWGLAVLSGLALLVAVMATWLWWRRRARSCSGVVLGPKRHYIKAARRSATSGR
ncbi:MAG: hypothetical protein U5K36_06415 [Roseovarius sp.]|nr:hypothetical protein [Roseovarius sp.]